MTTVTRTTTTVTRSTTEVPRRTRPARGWLMALGWILVATAVLGLIGTVQDLAHDYGFHLEGVQDGIHWALGIGALVVAYAVRDRMWLAATTLGFGVVLIAIGFVGLLTTASWHAGIGDSVGHLLLGTITLLVGIVSLNRERDMERRRSNAPRAA
jgi:peptidoglycan/LPS O-acetylase OafA/YrhL